MSLQIHYGDPFLDRDCALYQRLIAEIATTDVTLVVPSSQERQMLTQHLVSTAFEYGFCGDPIVSQDRFIARLCDRFSIAHSECPSAFNRMVVRAVIAALVKQGVLSSDNSDNKDETSSSPGLQWGEIDAKPGIVSQVMSAIMECENNLISPDDLAAADITSTAFNSQQLIDFKAIYSVVMGFNENLNRQHGKTCPYLRYHQLGHALAEYRLAPEHTDTETNAHPGPSASALQQLTHSSHIVFYGYANLAHNLATIIEALGHIASRTTPAATVTIIVPPQNIVAMNPSLKRSLDHLSAVFPSLVPTQGLVHASDQRPNYAIVGLGQAMHEVRYVAEDIQRQIHAGTDIHDIAVFGNAPLTFEHACHMAEFGLAFDRPITLPLTTLPLFQDVVEALSLCGTTKPLMESIDTLQYLLQTYPKITRDSDEQALISSGRWQRIVTALGVVTNLDMLADKCQRLATEVGLERAGLNSDDCQLFCTLITRLITDFQTAWFTSTIKASDYPLSFQSFIDAIGFLDGPESELQTECAVTTENHDTLTAVAEETPCPFKDAIASAFDAIFETFTTLDHYLFDKQVVAIANGHQIFHEAAASTRVSIKSDAFYHWARASQGRTTTTPPTPIAYHDLRALLPQQFAMVYVLHCNEGQLPSTSSTQISLFSESDKARLNHALGTQLNLQIESCGRQQAAFHYAALRYARKTCIFSYSMRVDNDREGLLSRFIPEYQATPLIADYQPLAFWHPNDPQKDEHSALTSTTTIDPSTSYSSDLKGSILKDFGRAISASALEAYTACPYRFRSERLWRLQVFEPGTFTPLESGNLVHAILEKCFQDDDFVNALTTGEARLPHIVPLVAKGVKQACQTRLWGTPFLEKLLQPRITNMIDRAMTVEAEQLKSFPSRYRYATEVAVTGHIGISEQVWRDSPVWGDNSVALQSFSDKKVLDWHHPSTFLNIPFSGRIDRVDYDSTHNRLMIIDYKEGRAKAIGKTAFEKGRRFQMALYLQALAAMPQWQQYEGVAALYFHLRDTVKKHGLFKSSYANILYALSLRLGAATKDTQWSAVLTANQQQVVAVLKSISANNYPALPAEAIQCQTCRFRRICCIKDTQHGASKNDQELQ